eukprot:CAMPEP_0194725472 /NCGR_PEP_ID=MMETSP0296-20130528/26986_1 /TAXON_ID=39354 /ORGANISM="Heterosigma akashiwo, Strain CCMP2393" /LENGTH=192 /DNA_ID=CAMNT_0039629971 /DNA_START=169 /DNA_END=745 /DNA_ORIENTATION=+
MVSKHPFPAAGFSQHHSDELKLHAPAGLSLPLSLIVLRVVRPPAEDEEVYSPKRPQADACYETKSSTQGNHHHCGESQEGKAPRRGVQQAEGAPDEPDQPGELQLEAAEQRRQREDVTGEGAGGQVRGAHQDQNAQEGHYKHPDHVDPSKPMHILIDFQWSPEVEGVRGAADRGVLRVLRGGRRRALLQLLL